MRLIALRDAVKSYGSRTVLRGLDLEVDERARIGVDRPERLRARARCFGSSPGSTSPTPRRRCAGAGWSPPTSPSSSAPTRARRSRSATPPGPTSPGSSASSRSARSGWAAPRRSPTWPVMQRAINRQERLIQEYDQLGGHTFDGTVRGHLQTLGLTDAEIERPHAELSGGKRKLVALAACLAQEPDLLLLDEPETHLDAVRRSGLEELVGEFPGAVVMVSHDRYLLDETVDRDRRARPRASSACGPATTRPTRPPASSSSSSRRPRSPRSRRRSRASRRRSGATSSGRAWSTTAATRSGPETPSGGSSGWTRSSGRCSSGAGSASRCGAASAAESASPSCATSRPRSTTTPCCSTSTSRSSAASGSASSAETAAGRASS